MLSNDLEKDLTKFLNLNLATKAKKGGFELFTRFMRNKEVIEITRNFVSHLDGDINPRQLLSVFLIAAHPEYTLSSDRNDLEEQVYQKANTLISLLDKETFDKDIFTSGYQKYDTVFNEWKQKDRQDLIQIISKTHKQVEVMADSIPDEGEGKPIKETLENLENMAHQLGGKPAVEHVKNSSQYGLIDENILMSQIAQQMHQGFWDIFTQELSEEPPNFKQYPDMILEIKTRLMKLLPRINNEEASVYLNTHLDENLIRQQIENNTYSLQKIYDLCIFCLERVKELGAPEDETLFNDYIERVHTEMSSETVKISQIIPNVFKITLEKLDHIGFLKDNIQDVIANSKK